MLKKQIEKYWVLGLDRGVRDVIMEITLKGINQLFLSVYMLRSAKCLRRRN